MSDLCYHCDGTGERDFLSGARCYECNGTGLKQEKEIADEDLDDYWDSMEELADEYERREREDAINSASIQDLPHPADRPSVQTTRDCNH